MDHLDFESPIVELRQKIDSLRRAGDENGLNLTAEIIKLEERLENTTRRIFNNLSDWQITQTARHPARPYFMDYVSNIFDDATELHGDRHYGDDKALVGFLATLDGKPVMVLGHQKGREVAEKVKRNFGMPRPEGYRKALRLMRLAEKFSLPILTFIDTPGAYPGIGAEERGQSEAIARNLEVMSRLKVPVISLVIGEGGSGGALAIGVCDYLMMLQYSVYSVISPEGCASILWRDAKYADQAAKAMSVTAAKLHKLKMIDEVIEEPFGGAHRDPTQVFRKVKAALIGKLTQLGSEDTKDLLTARYNRLMGYGRS